MSVSGCAGIDLSLFISGFLFVYLFCPYFMVCYLFQGNILSKPSLMTTMATQRMASKRQTLDEAYAPPANFLEIEVGNPITHGVGKNRFTDYEVRMRVRVLFLFFYLCLDQSPYFQTQGYHGQKTLF